MGSAVSSVESVRLDPQLKRDLLLRAAEEHIRISVACQPGPPADHPSAAEPICRQHRERRERPRGC